MNLMVVLEVVIGLCLIYLAASLVVTQVNEYISQIFKMRAKQLMKSLKKLISDPAMVTHLSKNPALAKLFEAGPDRTTSSYVNTMVVAQQIVGGLKAIAGADAAGTNTVQSLVSAAGSLNDPNFKGQLIALLNSTDDKIDKVVENVSTWLEQSLTMLGEEYKKNVQIISFCIGFAVAGLCNIDTVNIVSRLYHDNETREALVNYAEDLVDKVSKEKFEACTKMTPEERAKDPACVALDRLATDLKKREGAMARLPIGWPADPPLWGSWFGRIVGWLLTALATALGSTFWFDMLGRVINIRSGMRKPKPEEQT